MEKILGLAILPPRNNHTKQTVESSNVLRCSL